MTLTSPPAPDEHVLGRHIPVHDAGLLGLEQRLADLQDDGLGSIERHRARAQELAPATRRHTAPWPRTAGRRRPCRNRGRWRSAGWTPASAAGIRVRRAPAPPDWAARPSSRSCRRPRRRPGCRWRGTPARCCHRRCGRPPGSGSCARGRRRRRLQALRTRRRRAGLLGTEVSVVGIRALAGWAEFHQAPGVSRPLPTNRPSGSPGHFDFRRGLRRKQRLCPRPDRSVHRRHPDPRAGAPHVHPQPTYFGRFAISERLRRLPGSPIFGEELRRRGGRVPALLVLALAPGPVPSGAGGVSRFLACSKPWGAVIYQALPRRSTRSPWPVTCGRPRGPHRATAATGSPT